MDYLLCITFSVILCVVHYQPAFSQYTPEPFDVRLVDGPSPSEGRLEVLHQGRWGTVCDDGFYIEEADVACRQLGYDFAIAYRVAAFYGQGNGNISLDDVNCRGNETSLTQCYYLGLWSGFHNCGPHEDVGVKCGNSADWGLPVRFHGSWYDHGVLLALYNGSWGYVCSNYWGIDEANVACRQILGLEYGAKSYSTWMRDLGHKYVIAISCQGDETNFTQCDIDGVSWARDFDRDCGSELVDLTCEVPVQGSLLSIGKIAGLTVVCILFVTMLVVVPLACLRFKKPKTMRLQTTGDQQQVDRVATPGQPIPPGPTTVMYTNSPTDASGQVSYQQQPVGFQQPINSQTNVASEPGAASGDRIREAQEEVPLM